MRKSACSRARFRIAARVCSCLLNRDREGVVAKPLFCILLVRHPGVN